MYDIIGTGDPALSMYIANSDELADLLIHDFKEMIDMGCDPNDVIDEVFAGRGASSTDLTDYDKDRLMKTISAYWEAYND